MFKIKLALNAVELRIDDEKRVGDNTGDFLP